MRNYPSTRTRVVSFGFKGISEQTNGELTDPAYASSALNYAFDNGCITGRIGIDPAKSFAEEGGEIPQAPKPIKNIFHYKFTTKEGKRDDRLVARLSDNKIWFVKLFDAEPQWKQVPNLEIRGQVEAVNYNLKDRDRMLFCADESPLFMLDDETPLYCEQAPSFSCFAIHNERLFGGVNGEKTRLWFSDDYDPFNWRVSADEAGYITFDDGYGDIIKVMSFLGYLYIFREYGIFRLSAFSDQSEFSLRKVYLDSERIFKNSIAFAGGWIIFMTTGGLYAFDGYSVKRVARNLPDGFEDEDMSATFLDGYYWLSCKFAGGRFARTVRYETASGALSMMGSAEVNNLLAVRAGGQEQVFVAFSDPNYCLELGVTSKSGKLMGQPTVKRYSYEPSTLGNPREKTVTTVSVKSLGKAQLTVMVDSSSYTYDLRSSDFVQKLFVGAKGRLVGISLKSEDAVVETSPIMMELEVHSR